MFSRTFIIERWCPLGAAEQLAGKTRKHAPLVELADTAGLEPAAQAFRVRLSGGVPRPVGEIGKHNRLKSDTL